MISVNTTTLKSTALVSQTNGFVTPPSTDYSPLLLFAFAATATYHFSKKQMRKMARKMAWQMVKAKFKNMFTSKKNRKSPHAENSYGWLGWLVIPIIALGFFVSWLWALVVTLAIVVPFLIVKKHKA